MLILNQTFQINKLNLRKWQVANEHNTNLKWTELVCESIPLHPLSTCTRLQTPECHFLTLKHSDYILCNQIATFRGLFNRTRSNRTFDFNSMRCEALMEMEPDIWKSRATGLGASVCSYCSCLRQKLNKGLLKFSAHLSHVLCVILSSIVLQWCSLKLVF